MFCSQQQIAGLHNKKKKRITCVCACTWGGNDSCGDDPLVVFRSKQTVIVGCSSVAQRKNVKIITIGI